jgi:UDP-N-acetyl-D-mannosaminuronate dehydrogenase
MKERYRVAVVGLGEIGKPIYELVSKYHHTVGIDIVPVEEIGQVGVMHVCYPFQIHDFVEETARYIDLYRPALTIINSTVAIGTTRRIAERTRSAVVNSPVRGKHARMLQELQSYVKFIGALDRATAAKAVEHFRSLGVQTRTLSSPEATELAKLTETTYFGVLIAWAQQVERYCDQAGEDYDEVVSFFEEIKYLPPVKFFPGIVGGHCVLPNIELLSTYGRSVILDAIEASNQTKREREAEIQGRMVAPTA